MDLPWSDYLYYMPNDSAKETFNLVLKKKQDISIGSLSKKMPKGFRVFAKHICKLKHGS
jgi:hypothetical protein